VDSIDCSGQELTRLPKWSASANLQHDFALGDAGSLSPRVDLQAATRRFLDIAYGPNGVGPGYLLENFDLAFVPAGGRYTLTAYVDNLSNRAIYTEGNFIGTGQPAPNGYAFYAASINPPRTYGIRARVHF
jgi:iron complex outermembrane receptor protein